MNRLYWYMLLCGLLFILAGFVISLESQVSLAPSTEKTITIGGQVVHIDVADTVATREQGLSGRADLSEDEGMLFVFPEDGSYGFWMKDMLFSIDIVWISQEGDIVDITSRVSPDTYPEAFFPQKPVRYVLELSAGFVERHDVQIGDKTTL